MQQYQATCNQCQTGADAEKLTVPGDCEYCAGVCYFHGEFDLSSPILCLVKRNMFEKRDTGCDGIVNVIDGGTHVRDFTVSAHGQTTTVDCLAGNQAACAGNTQSHQTATEGDHTFSGFAPADAGATQYTTQYQTNKPATGIIIGQTMAAAPIQGGSGKPGTPCKLNGVTKSFDKCGVCGGNGMCSSGSALAVSAVLGSVLLLASLAL